MMTLVTLRSECHWKGRSRAIAGAVALRSLVVVKGPTGPGTRLPTFFSGRRGAELGEGNQVVALPRRRHSGEGPHRTGQ